MLLNTFSQAAELTDARYKADSTCTGCSGARDGYEGYDLNVPFGPRRVAPVLAARVPITVDCGRLAQRMRLPFFHPHFCKKTGFATKFGLEILFQQQAQ